MDKIAELTIGVNAKLCVDRDTAELCLKLVEIYANANNVQIMGEKDPYQVSNDTHYYFQREEYR